MATWFSRRKKQSEPEVSKPQEREEAATHPRVSDPTHAERDSSAQDLSTQESSASDVPAKQTIWYRGLSRLRRAFIGPLDRLFQAQSLSEEVFTELEEVLLGADVGVQTTSELIEQLKERCRRERPEGASALRAYLKEELLSRLQALPTPPPVGEIRPWVILMVGVNGVGKTTTIAKLAMHLSQARKKVLLVAADTFRAAAIEQLEAWAHRLNIALIKHQSGASPAAVAFDGVRAGVARQVDVIIIDTAGRLHTKAPLMEELKKIHRVVAKELPGAPHDILIVLDATTGQNALTQAQTFQQMLPLTGVILTKMDGSGKGGVVLSVAEKLKIPIRYIGLGEREGDLQDFRAEVFIEALFAPPDLETISLDTTPSGQ